MTHSVEAVRRVLKPLPMQPHDSRQPTNLDLQLVGAALVRRVRRTLDCPLQLREVVPDEPQLNAGSGHLLAADDLAVLPLDSLRRNVRHVCCHADSSTFPEAVTYSEKATIYPMPTSSPSARTAKSLDFTSHEKRSVFLPSSFLRSRNYQL